MFLFCLCRSMLLCFLLLVPQYAVAKLHVFSDTRKYFRINIKIIVRYRTNAGMSMKDNCPISDKHLTAQQKKHACSVQACFLIFCPLAGGY